MTHLNVRLPPEAFKRVDISVPPPQILDNASGCWDCPMWGRIGSAIGRCACPDNLLKAAGSDARQGWMTSFAYICPAHPRFTP